MAKQTWTEERTNTLIADLPEGTFVTLDVVAELAERLEVSTRSISSKLRRMGYDVQKVDQVPTKTWADEETQELVDFIKANPNQYTYAEIAAAVVGGKYTTKQVQGKILSLELHESVKPTEKAVAARTYTPEQEEKFLELAAAGASIETIAEALDKSIESVRGKALSFLRSVEGFVIPKQAESRAKIVTDPWDGINTEDFTVEELSEKLDKSIRGIKTTLTRRGLKAANYDGAARAAKAAEKRAAEQE